MVRKTRKTPRQVKPDPLTDAPDDVETSEATPLEDARDEQLCAIPEIKDALIEVFAEVEEGYQDQANRSDEIMDYWDLYNCKLGVMQTYAGNSKIFVPIVKNAIEARKTRFVNQCFPQSGRNVDVTSGERRPNDIVALIEHYIRRCKLRTQMMPALVKNGDIEGSYHVYVSWEKFKRNVMFKAKKPLVLGGEEVPGTEADDMTEEELEFGRPLVEVLADADVCILPASADSIENALSNGGSVTVLRRWSKAKVKKMAKDGEIDDDACDLLLGQFDANKGAGQQDKQKKMVDAAGIHTEGNRSFALVYETWTMLTYKDKRQLYKCYFGGEEIILGCKRNPFWSDRCPVISAPVDKVQGAFKGISKLKACADMQYAANDAVNEGMDSAAYSLLPIIMTDPLKNPRIGTMVLNLAAIWETSPKDTQFAQFPELWKSAFEIVGACQANIFQTLSVTPAMVPQSTSSSQKRNQAEIAMEAQIDVLSTADAVTVLEEGVLTPLLNWFVELDHQYRDKSITVKQYGEMGVRANMETIEPVQMETRYEFMWSGVEAARTAQQVQNQIAMMNVLRGIPPQQYAPMVLDLKPLIANLVDSTFSARLAPEIFKDPRSELSQNPQIENGMLADGYDLPVHPLDEDAQHIQVHQQAMQAGDPHMTIQLHIAKHIQQMTLKAQQQAMTMMPQAMGMPGVPGGEGPGGPQPAPGVAGTPRMGAQPALATGGQSPPGTIHADQLNGTQAPRR